jgi:hypothetical protein
MAAYGTMDAAILGLPYGLDFTVESFPAAADITAGRPVYQTPGTPGTVKATYAGGDVFVGIALFDQRADVASVGTYKQYDVVNVLTRGQIYVQNAVAVSTAPVAAYATSGGLFSTTASGNYNCNTMFRANQATVSGLALIEVNGAKLVA